MEIKKGTARTKRSIGLGALRSSGNEQGRGYTLFDTVLWADRKTASRVCRSISRGRRSYRENGYYGRDRGAPQNVYISQNFMLFPLTFSPPSRQLPAKLPLIYCRIKVACQG